MVVPAIRQAMNQPWVAVEGENHRDLGGEDGVVILVGQAVRMFALRLQRHQVDDIDEANLQIRNALPEQDDCGQRLNRGHVA